MVSMTMVSWKTESIVEKVYIRLSMLYAWLSLPTKVLKKTIHCNPLEFIRYITMNV